MRLIIYVFILLCLHGKVQAQYRIRYEGQPIPELYNRLQLVVEEQTGSGYKTLPSKKYNLNTDEGTYEDGYFVYDRTRVYRNKGNINFLLFTDGKQQILKLAVPILEDIRFNLYTDSIKPVLNYYLNVEGKFSSGRVYPLDTNFVTVHSNHSTMQGLEWILPKIIDFDAVTFTVVNKLNVNIKKQITLYINRYKDPKDDPNYQERTEEEIIRGSKRKR